MDATLIARCAHLRDHLAMCQVVLSGTTPPEWIQLIPAGPEVDAFDGRKFRNTKPETVVEAFKASPLEIPIDYEHASEIRGPKGEEAPAAGWITDLEVRSGSIWGKVEWTPKGAASLTAREYRYVSPAFRHDKAGNVTQIVSAGLTNRPALQLAELARNQGEEMNPKILKMLGLAEGATPEQIEAAVTAHEAKSAKTESELSAARSEVATARAELVQAKTPDLNSFVPRADYQLALTRAETAEKQISEQKAATHKATVDMEIEAALKAGKITPATKGFYVTTCSTAEGLASFREFVKSAAPIAPTDGGIPPTIPGGGNDPTKLTEQEIAVARNCGVSEEMFLKAKSGK